VHYEPLTALVPLSFSPHDTDIFDTITRFLGAFKKAASKLEAYYEELPSQTCTLASIEAGFPYPTTFSHLQTQVNTPLKLKDQPIPGKLLFVGWTEGKLVLVKFVRSYSKDLHEHCAALNLAPLLLGFEKLPGDWLMVVMEFMTDGYRVFSTLKDLPPSIFTQIRQMVTDLVTSFHAKNLVHGDIRDTNLLVRVKDGTVEMKLIDFDWGGKEGEVRYPVLINNHTVVRPSNVVGGRLITTDHDLEMVKITFQDLP
jgi:hypothetical protein